MLKRQYITEFYHPRGYVKPQDGGAMVEYDAIKNHVTMWNVAVEKANQSKRPRCRKICRLCNLYLNIYL